MKSARSGTSAVLLFVFSLSCAALSQETKFQTLQGSVSFISPQNIYVKFSNTNGIAAGDTIFFDNNGKIQPAMIAKYLSSQSCAGPKVGTIELKVGDAVFALEKAESIKPIQHSVTTKDETAISGKISTPSSQDQFISNNELSSRFYGSFSSNSYSNFTNTTGDPNIQRYSHSLSINAENVDGTPLYFSTYSNLSYLTTDWPSMKANIFNNWKIYDVAAGYKEPDYDVWFGRHINSNASNLGPIDGVQGEGRLGNFWLGGLVGSRPDFYSMSFNIRFFEVGAYLSRVDTMASGPMQNTIGIFQQTNDLKTDRRFLYLQHSSIISPGLSLFASTEVDLFKVENNQPMNTLSLTSLYMSAQVSPTRDLMVNLSYDARRDVIYYQTFASTFDSLFQNQLRQGFRLWLNWRPVPMFIVTVNGGYSYQKGDPLPSRDGMITLTEPEIPLIDISASISYNRIVGSYLNGTVYGINLTKYFPFSFSNLSIGYQRVNYSFGTSTSPMLQNIGTVQLSFRVVGQVFFNLYYEGIFSHQTTYGTLVGGFTFRF